MANNWIGGPTAPSDPSTFDYDTAALKVQRQRAAAQALQAQGLQTNQGQFIKSGDFMGYAGGNTLGSTLAHVAAAVLGANANDNADTAQKQLGLDSQSALSYALDPNNAPAAKRAIAAQQQSEADMQLQRESQRGTSTVQGGDYQDPQAGSQGVQTFPVSAPEQITPTPMAPAASQAAAKALSAPAPMPAPVPQTVPVGQPMPVTGGPQSFGTGANFSKSIAPPTNLPTGASGPLSASDIAFASKMLGGVPAPSAVSPGRQQNAPQATGAPTSTPALPPMPPQMPAAPAMTQQAPAPQPAAPTLEDQGRGGQVQGDPRSMVDQAAANAQPTTADQIAQLQAIARTGPMGQQLATAQMNNMFGSKVGRYKTTVMADSVNGGFVKVTEDSATGASQTERIGSPNGTLVTGQTTDANGNRLNVHKDGSTSAMLDASGKPVVDSTLANANTTKALDIAGKKAELQGTIGAIKNGNETLDEIDQLAPKWAGTRYRVIPDAVAPPDLLRYRALLGQDLLSGFKNDLETGEAGSVRGNKAEYESLRKAGSINENMDAQTVHNLTAKQRIHTQALMSGTQEHLDQITNAQGGMPQSNPQGSNVPGRGQTVSAGQWGFK